MTDRIRSLTVALTTDLREDDVLPLVDAIRQLRGVLSVTTTAVTPNDWTTEQRVRLHVLDALQAVLFPTPRA
jgi:hypothetical protein